MVRLLATTDPIDAAALFRQPSLDYDDRLQPKQSTRMGADWINADKLDDEEGDGGQMIMLH